MRNTPWKFAVILIGVLAFALVAVFLWQRNTGTEMPIGGDWDAHGCLTSAGYAFDAEIGACIRAFEMTPDIKQAAKMAVEKAGIGYALTVASFNSYEEVGAYDIMLERGVERAKETIYIRNWRVVQTP